MTLGEAVTGGGARYFEAVVRTQAATSRCRRAAVALSVDLLWTPRLRRPACADRSFRSLGASGDGHLTVAGQALHRRAGPDQGVALVQLAADLGVAFGRQPVADEAAAGDHHEEDRPEDVGQLQALDRLGGVHGARL